MRLVQVDGNLSQQRRLLFVQLVGQMSPEPFGHAQLARGLQQHACLEKRGIDQRAGAPVRRFVLWFQADVKGLSCLFSGQQAIERRLKLRPVGKGLISSGHIAQGLIGQAGPVSCTPA